VREMRGCPSWDFALNVMRCAAAAPVGADLAVEVNGDVRKSEVGQAARGATGNSADGLCGRRVPEHHLACIDMAGASPQRAHRTR